MRTKYGSRLVFVTLAVLIGCGGERSEPGKKTPPEASDAVPAPAKGDAIHADASVTPGSYEDWCAKHGVQESLCTRCNPTLVAAFKATGDWCGEHGLPESQCLQCNPDLKIVRPAKAEVK